MDYKLLETNEIKEIYFKSHEKYNEILTNDLKNWLNIYINETNLENREIIFTQIKQKYNLNDNLINELLLVVKMERIYIELLNTINTFLDLSSENKKLADEIYEDILVEVNVFKNTFKILYEELQEITVLRINHYSELSTVKNFIVFINDVENDRKLNLNSKSGKGLSSISKILSEIKLLMESDFDILRSKGKIHQINSPDWNGIVFSKYRVAYERAGTGETK